MPRIVTPLTDTKIKNARIKEKNYTLSDGKGLHILIKKNGIKFWEFVYQSPIYHKRRKTSFGSYPDTKLIQARAKREECKNLINEGIDPIDHFKRIKEEKENNKKGLFVNVVDEWLKKEKKKVKNKSIVPKTYQRIESLLLNDVLPYFKKVENKRRIKPIFNNANIKDIKHTHISKVIEEKNNTAPVSAKRLLQYLNKLWAYAVDGEYCEYNIIQKIDKESYITATRIKHHPKIVDLNILQELINAIYNYSGHYSTRNALKFVLHVPLRAANLVTLKWNYINFDKKLLTIPREEMKIKDDRLPDFEMPLSDEVMEILKEQKSYKKFSKFVFVSDYGQHLNIETTNKALQRLGFNDEKRGRKQRTHSFRGTFRSLANTYQTKHNAIFEVKETALDHTIGSLSERAYTGESIYTPQLRELMQWWSGFVVGMLDE